MSHLSAEEHGTIVNNDLPGNGGEETPSIELNLRLDENGRTAPSLHSVSAYVSGAKPNCTNLHRDGDENPSKRAKIDSEQKPMVVDYSSKTTLTNVHDTELEEAMDSLLFDCEVIQSVLSSYFYFTNHQSFLINP